MRLAALVAIAAALAAPQSPSPQDDIIPLLTKASAWTMKFEKDLSGLLFRERLRQDTERSTAAGSVPSAWAGIRTVRPGGDSISLEANVFLLKPRGGSLFVVYRDVYRVASNNLTDHTDRLADLLVEGDNASIDEVRRLTDASARYNIGKVARNTNVPTMALEYLKPQHLPGLRVRMAGRDAIDGRGMVIIEFEEIARPTVVRGEEDGDAPASGRYWIDPATGAVPRAVIQLTVGEYTGELDIRLAWHDRLDVWVPAEMKESWLSGPMGTRATARYDRFQRLSVSTDEIIK